MTEQEWLVCNDPSAMFDFVSGVISRIHDAVEVDVNRRMSPRKARLLACTCSKESNNTTSKMDGKLTTVDYAELIADGLRRSRINDAYIVSSDAHHVARVCLMGWDRKGRSRGDVFTARCGIIRELFNPFWRRAVTPLGDVKNGWAITVYAGDADPRWLTWNNGTVPKLAEGIYQDKAWEHMPILADALEEAGCMDTEILNHCRGLKRCPKWNRHYVTHEQARKPFYEGSSCNDCCKTPGWIISETSHYRGCWVLDLLTGRS